MSTAILDIEKKKTLVPKLRFKEFDKKWLIKPLGDECNHISYGLTIRPEFVEEGIPLISAREITSEKVNIDIAPKIKISDFNKLSDKAKPKKGDIFLTKTGTIGYSARFTENIPIAITQNIAVIRINNININSPLYLLQYFKTRNFYRSAISKVNQSTIMDLQLGDIRKLKIPFPSFPEQQKIASFLSAVDEKIQQLSRKKELLEQYKKGVMQQLFSGKLRFKDENGEDYPDWEEKTFGDIYSFYTTNSLSREKLNYESGVVKNIHYGDIHTKFKTLFDIQDESVPFINSDFDVSKIKNECYCQEGDLVIADASEDYADIGKSIEIVNLENEKVVAGLHTFLARPNKTKMFVGFSGYLVRSTNFRKQIMTIAQGSKVLSISTGRLAMVNMNVPCVQEQQKIADFLSSIDVKIETTNQQITQTQSFKKGLLQRMFV